TINSCHMLCRATDKNSLAMMNFYNFMLTALLVTIPCNAADNSQSENCPDNFIDAAGGCFYVGQQESPGITEITWLDAQELCSVMSTDEWFTALAKFDSTEQLESLSEQWAIISSSMYDYPYMWIGLTKELGSDKWMWLDGISLSPYSNMWREGYPTNDGEFAYLVDVKVYGSTEYGRLQIEGMPQVALRRYVCQAT
ncbi:unnamed protein product, partial [Meganyctiphanes norvegica]